MRVSLRGLDGVVTGVREVAAPDDCQERAGVAAVLISAWVGAWTTGGFPDGTRPVSSATLRSPPTFPRAAEPPRSAPAAPAPSPPAASTVPGNTSSQPSPVLAQTAAPTSAPTGAGSPVAVAPMRPASSRRGWAMGLELAGHLFGTHDGDAGALGGGLEVGLVLPGWLSVASLLESTRDRDRPLAPAVATYRTYRLGLGLGARHRWAHVVGQAGLFPEVTLLTVDGQQLTESRRVSTWGAAGALRGRLGIPVGRICPFLFAGASLDLRAQRLTLEGSQASIVLSRWNLSVGVGLAYRFGSRS